MIALGLLAGIGFGIGIGYWMGRGKAQTEMAGALEPSQALVMDRTPSASPALIGGPGENRSVAPNQDTAGTLVEVGPGEVKALVASIEAVAPKADIGEGVIKGFIRDEVGSGVGGVVVRASLNSSENIGATTKGALAAPALDSLQMEMEESARRILEGRVNLREATSAPDGSYTLSGLPDGPWRVQAYKEHYRCEPRAGTANKIVVGMDLDFVAEAVQCIEFDIVNADGTPCDEAVLEWVQGQSGDAFKAKRFAPGPKKARWTPEEPNLCLSAGNWTVRALHELTIQAGDRSGRQTASSFVTDQEVVRVDLAGTDQKVQLRLKKRHGISGRVILADQEVNLKNINICISSLETGGTPDLLALAQTGNESMVFAMINGSYTFQDLEPGSYVVGAKASSRGEIIASAVVEVVDGQVEADLVIDRLDRSQYLTVHILDSAGDPIDVPLFRYNYSGSEGNSSGVATPIPLRPSGCLLTLPVDMDPLDVEATLLLTARHNELGEKAVEVRAGQTEVTISYAPSTSLHVTLTDIPAGDIRARTHISVVKQDGSDNHSWMRFGQNTTPDSRGVVEVGGLEPGAYTVRVSLQDTPAGFSIPGSAIASVDVELRAGVNEVRLAMPTLYQLSVFAPEEEPGTTVRLSATQKDMISRMSTLGTGKLDESGRFVFADVAAGTFNVRAGQSKATAEVPGGEVVLERRRSKASSNK